MPIFNCRFTASKLDGSKVRRSFKKISAPTQEAAVDAIKDAIGLEYEKMFYPTFRFGPTKFKLDPAVLATANAALNSPEEA